MMPPEGVGSPKQHIWDKITQPGLFLQGFTPNLSQGQALV